MKVRIIIIILTLIGIVSCNNYDEHKIVICIPVYGQSLALGVEADRITDFDSLAEYANGRIVTEHLDHQFGYYDLNDLKQFAKKILHHQKTSYELSVYSMAKWIADHTGEDTLICIFPGGQDGSIISNLGKGSKPYLKFVNDIKTAYLSAKAKDWSFEIPSICWMQGETDVNSYPGTNYKELLLQFAKDINLDIKEVTGQKKDVSIICYQTNSLTRAAHFDSLAYNCPETEVAQTQLELVRDNPIFYASGPTYPYDCVNDIIHIDGIGQQRHGILVALAANDILKHHNRQHGLLPQNIEVRDQEIIIDFMIPYPPLFFDTIHVAKAAHYGFSVITPDNRDIIQDVTLNNNKICILCTEPPKQCRIRYAVNGESMKSGRLHGPRGNLRDSQGDSLSIVIQGEKYPIYNWCYQFDIPFERKDL